MVRCLHALGCPWGSPEPGKSVFSQAVRGGAPMPVITFMRRSGCPVDWEDAACGEGCGGSSSKPACGVLC